LRIAPARGLAGQHKRFRRDDPAARVG
jgi:hypothetical protein